VRIVQRGIALDQTSDLAKRLREFSDILQDAAESGAAQILSSYFCRTSANI
jgi:arginyl-tRNA synthetase